MPGSADVRGKASKSRAMERSYGQQQYEAAHASGDPYYASIDRSGHHGQIRDELLDVDVKFNRSAKATL